jgi:hypothetical protein
MKPRAAIAPSLLDVAPSLSSPREDTAADHPETSTGATPVVIVRFACPQFIRVAAAGPRRTPGPGATIRATFVPATPGPAAKPLHGTLPGCSSGAGFTGDPQGRPPSADRPASVCA